MAEELIKEIQEMDESEIAKVREFVRFMKFESSHQDLEKPKKKRTLGKLKDHFEYMADDFKDTPDCLKEYTV